MRHTTTKPHDEDGSRSKALAFCTAFRILRRRLPLSAGRGPQSVTRESLDAEISAAKAWLVAHPATTGKAGQRNVELAAEALGRKAKELLDSLPEDQRSFNLKAVSPEHWWLV